MLKQVGLFVGAPPGDLQHARQEALGETVAANHFFRPAQTLGGELDHLAPADGDEAVALQALQHARHRRRRHAQAIGKAHGDHALALIVVEAVDRAQVVVAGDVCDLLWHRP